jgi:hypothetical protein
MAHEQYDLRAHFSTEKPAFSLINNILTAMNNKQIVGVCNLQKAFDCVDHKILLEKLEFYGVKGIFKKLIISYLTSRYQRVVMGLSSKWEITKSGVPQASILRPLFLFYINDLSKIINKDNNMVLHANDNSVIITDTNNMNFKMNLNQTFKNTNTWFNVKFLTLNFNKTQYLEFRFKNGCNIVTQIGYDQKIIFNVAETKFLGLTIDDTLTWEQHIDMVINRLSSTCYALQNIKYMLSFGTSRLIYFAHVQSIMNYGIILWAGSSYPKKVFILQRKIAVFFGR